MAHRRMHGTVECTVELLHSNSHSTTHSTWSTPWSSTVELRQRVNLAQGAPWRFHGQRCRWSHQRKERHRRSPQITARLNFRRLRVPRSSPRATAAGGCCPRASAQGSTFSAFPSAGPGALLGGPPWPAAPRGFTDRRTTTRELCGARREAMGRRATHRRRPSDLIIFRGKCQSKNERKLGRDAGQSERRSAAYRRNPGGCSGLENAKLLGHRGSGQM